VRTQLLIFGASVSVIEEVPTSGQCVLRQNNKVNVWSKPSLW